MSNDTSELYVTVGGLLPCTNYTFSVRAGDGNFSQPIEASTDYVGKFSPRVLIMSDINLTKFNLTDDI